MTEALQILGLVVAVAVVAASARRLGLSRPWSSPWSDCSPPSCRRPDYQVSPEVVLIGFLPPLLYAGGDPHLAGRRPAEPRGDRHPGDRRGRVHDLWRRPWSPGQSSRVVGVAALWRSARSCHHRTPSRRRTIARRVNMPRRIVSILEGESLLNDATALVALRTSGRRDRDHGVDLDGRAGLRPAAGGGIVVGLVMSALLAKARRRVDDVVLDTNPLLVAPFLAYLAAEASTRAVCSRSSSSVCCSGTRHPPSSRHRPDWPSRPTGRPSPSSSRTPSSY